MTGYCIRKKSGSQVKEYCYTNIHKGHQSLSACFSIWKYLVFENLKEAESAKAEFDRFIREPLEIVEVELSGEGL